MFPDSPAGDAVPVPAPLMSPVLFPSRKPPSAAPSLGCISPSLPRAPLPLLHSCSARHAPPGAKPGYHIAAGISGSLRGLTCIFLQGAAKISSSVQSKIAVPGTPHLTLAWRERRHTPVPADRAGDADSLRGPKAFSSGSLFFLYWDFSAPQVCFSLGKAKIVCMNSASPATPETGQFRPEFSC